MSATTKPTVDKGPSNEDRKGLEINPVVPQAPKQTVNSNHSANRKPPSSISITAPATASSDDGSDNAIPEIPDPAAANIRNPTSSFQSKANWSRPLKLWQIDNTDVQELEIAVKQVEEEEDFERHNVLKGMHAVIVKSQSFRTHDNGKSTGHVICH